MRFHSCKNQCGQQTESLLFCPKDTVTVVFFFPPSILSQLSAWVWNKGTQRKTQDRQTKQNGFLVFPVKTIFKKSTWEAKLHNVPRLCVFYLDPLAIFFYKLIYLFTVSLTMLILITRITTRKKKKRTKTMYFYKNTRRKRTNNQVGHKALHQKIL